MTVRSLALTTEMLRQVGRVQRAAALYPNLDDGIRPLEVEQLRLAALVVDDVERQAARQVDRLARLPARARAVPVVVAVSLRRRRRGA